MIACMEMADVNTVFFFYFLSNVQLFHYLFPSKRHPALNEKSKISKFLSTGIVSK